MHLPVTTRHAAKAAGISLMTLQRWIANDDVQAPELDIVNGRATRLWHREDMERLRRAKEQIYCKGRGRKKKKRKR
jgi:hypothetical protein